MKDLVFFIKVSLMRDAQKEYFRTRSQDSLRKAKALEAEVDKIIQRARSEERSTRFPTDVPNPFQSLDVDFSTPAVPNDLYQH